MTQAKTSNVTAIGLVQAARFLHQAGRGASAVAILDKVLKQQGDAPTLREALRVAEDIVDVEAALAAFCALDAGYARGNHAEARARLRHRPIAALAVARGLPEPDCAPGQEPVAGRLLYLLHHALPQRSTGYATRGHGLARAMLAAGMDVVCLTRPGFPADMGLTGPTFPAEDLVDGVRYLHDREPMQRGAANLAAYAEAASEVIGRHIARDRPQVLMAASNHANALPGLIAARRAGIPFWYEVRGFWEVTAQSNIPGHEKTFAFALARAIETAVMKAADRVFTLTGAMRDDMIARGVDAGRIALLPNATDPDRFTPQPRDRALAARLNIPDGVPVIGYVGTFNLYEGLDDLARACAGLAGQGRDFRLLLVGDEGGHANGRGPVTSEILRIASETGLTDRLILPGRVPHDEVERYYSLIDIAPFPRKPDLVCELVSPLKPLEAMAMEKTVIVSSVAPLAEMITEGKTGLVFAKGDPKALAATLDRALSDAGLRARLGEAGRKWVAAERTWATMAARVAGALKQGRRDLPSALPVGMSVIVPSFRGRDYILDCLSSLDEQTLDKALYEVIVVLNGPDDGSSVEIEAFRAKHPDLRLRVMHSAPAGASRARNVGIDAAHFGFLCFVDDDDRIGPAYLATLLERSDSGSIAFADIVDIVGGTETPSPISRQIAEAAKIGRSTITDVHAAATMNAVKSVPTWMARSVQFDTDLKSGEDVVFWCALIARFRPGMTLAPASSNARYHRYVRPASLSRRQGYDFEVNERVDVIVALDRLRGQDSEGLSETKSFTQAGFIIRYLRQRPDDFARFATEHFHRIPPKVYAHIMKSLTRRLVVAYCFPPDMDTSAIVMAKRLRTDARPVEVLCNGMGDRRSKDSRLSTLVAPYVAGVHDLGAPVSFGSWGAISAFADKARTAFDRLNALRGFKDMYSRAMWPASHFAAAALKAAKPSLDWIAEFSDPLRLDIDGKQREGQLDLGWLSETGLRAELERAGFPVPTNDNLFFWAEYLPFCLADRIVFTNALQKAYMLDQPYPAAALARVERVSEISPHPQPDAELFRQRLTPLPLSGQKVNVGYFGNFYHNRNLNLLIEVLSSMDGAVRDRIHLHVFCNAPDMIKQVVRDAGIEEAVTGQPMLPYLDFLSQIQLFDYLLVTDTETQGRKSVNPYLPSKVSDYLGSGRAIWALYEPGSTLSGIELPAGSLRTRLGDRQGYADALTRMSAQAR